METDPLVSEWLAGYQSDKKRTVNATYFTLYLEYTGSKPQELLEQRDAHLTDGFVEKRVLAFGSWLATEKSKPESVVYNARSAINGFYGFHRRALQYRHGELKMPVPKNQDFPLSLAHIQACLHAAKLREKTLISVAESTGLRISDVIELKRGDIEPFLNDEPPVAFWDPDIGVTTIKERVPAFPFLHSTAIKYLREYLATHTSEWLFPTENGEHLSEKEANRLFRDAFKRTGFKTGNKRIRFHCLRKFTIGRLQDAGVETNMWKMLVGKKVLEKPYTSNQLRDAYVKALPKLDPEVLTNNHVRVEGLEDRIQQLEHENADLKNQLNDVIRKKSIDVLMDLYKQNQKEINKEAFKASMPASAALNGQKPVQEAIRIDGAEILTLKALAKTFQQLYNESKHAN